MIYSIFRIIIVKNNTNHDIQYSVLEISLVEYRFSYLLISLSIIKLLISSSEDESKFICFANLQLLFLMKRKMVELVLKHYYYTITFHKKVHQNLKGKRQMWNYSNNNHSCTSFIPMLKTKYDNE